MQKVHNRKRKQVINIDRVEGQYGFTLVEALIALALTGVILSIMFSGFAAYFKMYNSTEISLQLQQELRAALSKIENDVKNASGVIKHSQSRFQLLTFQNVKNGHSPKICTYYLYSNPHVALKQSGYELRRVVSSDTTVTNEKGQVVARHICPPPASQFNCELNSAGRWLIRPKLVLCKGEVTVSAHGCYSVRN